LLIEALCGRLQRLEILEAFPNFDAISMSFQSGASCSSQGICLGMRQPIFSLFLGGAEAAEAIIYKKWLISDPVETSKALDLHIDLLGIPG